MATLLTSFFFFQAEDGIRDLIVTGVQTCALPISPRAGVYSEGEPSALMSPWLRPLQLCPGAGPDQRQRRRAFERFQILNWSAGVSPASGYAAGRAELVVSTDRGSRIRHDTTSTPPIPRLRRKASRLLRADPRPPLCALTSRPSHSDLSHPAVYVDF